MRQETINLNQHDIMQIMRTTFLIALLTLIIVGCGNTNKVKQYHSSEVCVWKNGQWTTEWMQKYAEYVRNNDRFHTDQRIIDIWISWGLAYIDNDTIPEMVLLCPCEGYGNKVLSIYKGEVKEWNSWRCQATYISRSGLINNHDGHMGEYWDRVFLLKDGIFEEIFDHTDKLYRSHDKIDDTTVVDEYYCYFRGDTTLRIGSDCDCEEYHDIKNDIYTSLGEIINFGSIDHLSTSIFETSWSPDSVSKDAQLTLKVK